VKAVLRDVLGHGNEECLLPGQVEAEAAARSARHGGLLFSAAEMDAFAEIARECGAPAWDLARFQTVAF
jgi:ureidoglycolate dehydrogenase (NAD+)